MNQSNIPSPYEIVKKAMMQHGTPNWIAHVPSSVRKQVPSETITQLREKYATQSVEHRDTKQSRLDEWLSQNVFAHVTIGELATIGECSKALVRRKIRNRPDVFRRIDRSTYEIRDPQADRDADKSRHCRECNYHLDGYEPTVEICGACLDARKADK